MKRVDEQELKAKLQRLEKRARNLGKKMHTMVEQVEKQHTFQQQALDEWRNEMANLLTSLANLRVYLGIDVDGDSDDIT